MSKQAEYIAVGCFNGELQLFDENLQQIKSIKFAKEISIVKFSPNT